MSTNCPFCTRESPANALVCSSCGRDIAIPASLIAERDDLLQKRDFVREQLLRTRAELDRMKRNKQHRSL
jgi:hypothetical protein